LTGGGRLGEGQVGLPGRANVWVEAPARWRATLSAFGWWRGEPSWRGWAALILVAGAIPFFASTTFVGDDHLFLTFARAEPRPWRALWSDVHGGEFYRPVPMLVWWVLGRLPRALRSWAFPALALALHGAVAILGGAVLGTIRRGRARADGGGIASAPAAVLAPAPDAAVAVAAASFFLAPLPREAAYWYSASTDLLSVAFGLVAILALLAREPSRRVAILACTVACGSKETAVVFPLLALVALRAAGVPWRSTLARAWPLGVVVGGYVLARARVLHGWGGAGDPPAPLGARAIQIAAGVTQVFSAGAETPGWPSCLVGAGAWVGLLVLVWALGRSGRGRAPDAPPFIAVSVSGAAHRDGHGNGHGRDDAELASGWILLWLVISVGPLLAAPWVVGARYFYLAAVAGSFLLATALARGGFLPRLAVLSLLAGLSFARALDRRGEVRSYEARLGAVRRAVTAGLASGHRVFQVVAGIKDLDLAVKDDPALWTRAADFVILGDVPASFVVLPEGGGLELGFLFARPPLPPAGAYRFGPWRIVGLARAGDDPTLDEVVQRFPDLRLLRLVRVPGPRDDDGPPRLLARDVTEQWLDQPAPSGD
jgi:hypothetical protein